MTHIVRGGVLLISIAALMASASAPKQYRFEKSRSTPAGYGDAWSAVIDVFADKNWAILNMEKDSGLITTDWMSVGGDSPFADCGGAGLAVRQDRQVRFNVLVRELDEGATVTVNTTMREQRYFDRRVWFVDCVSTGRVEQIIHGLVDEAIAAHARRSRRARDTARLARRQDEGTAAAAAVPATGEEGGACYGNDTCNDGLVCDDASRCAPAVPSEP